MANLTQILMYLQTIPESFEEIELHKLKEFREFLDKIQFSEEDDLESLLMESYRCHRSLESKIPEAPKGEPKQVEIEKKKIEKTVERITLVKTEVKIIARILLEKYFSQSKNSNAYKKLQALNFAFRAHEADFNTLFKVKYDNGQTKEVSCLQILDNWPAINPKINNAKFVTYPQKKGKNRPKDNNLEKNLAKYKISENLEPLPDSKESKTPIQETFQTWNSSDSKNLQIHSHFRIRGDGNCLIYASILSMLTQAAIENKTHVIKNFIDAFPGIQTVSKKIKILDANEEYLSKAGFSEHAETEKNVKEFGDSVFYEVLSTFLQKVENHSNDSLSYLYSHFKQDQVFYYVISLYIRFKIYEEIKNNPEFKYDGEHTYRDTAFYNCMDLQEAAKDLESAIDHYLDNMICVNKSYCDALSLFALNFIFPGVRILSLGVAPFNNRLNLVIPEELLPSKDLMHWNNKPIPEKDWLVSYVVFDGKQHYDFLIDTHTYERGKTYLDYGNKNKHLAEIEQKKNILEQNKKNIQEIKQEFLIEIQSLDSNHNKKQRLSEIYIKTIDKLSALDSNNDEEIKKLISDSKGALLEEVNAESKHIDLINVRKQLLEVQTGIANLDNVADFKEYSNLHKKYNNILKKAKSFKSDATVAILWKKNTAELKSINLIKLEKFLEEEKQVANLIGEINSLKLIFNESENISSDYNNVYSQIRELEKSFNQVKNTQQKNELDKEILDFKTNLNEKFSTFIQKDENSIHYSSPLIRTLTKNLLELPKANQAEIKSNLDQWITKKFNQEAFDKIEGQINNLKEKIGDVDKHSNFKAFKCANQLLIRLELAEEDLKIDLNEAALDLKKQNDAKKKFNKTAETAITKAMPILKKDLNWGPYLLNLLKFFGNILSRTLTAGQYGLFTYKESDSSIAVKEAKKELPIDLENKNHPSM